MKYLVGNKTANLWFSCQYIHTGVTVASSQIIPSRRLLFPPLDLAALIIHFVHFWKRLFLQNFMEIQTRVLRNKFDDLIEITARWRWQDADDDVAISCALYGSVAMS